MKKKARKRPKTRPKAFGAGRGKNVNEPKVRDYGKVPRKAVKSG